MQPNSIKFYTSDTSVPEFLSFTRLLGENIGKPVELLPLSALPAPDRSRPTRQQLRTERAAQLRALTTCQDLLKLSEPHERLGDEVTSMRLEIVAHEVRIAEIDQLLGDEKGGQDNA